MASTSIISVPRIVFCSSDNTIENTKYIKTLSKEGYKPEISTTIDSISNFLKTNSESTYIVIVCGPEAENSVQNLTALDNVAAVVQFSESKDTKWDNACNKVSKFYNKFTEVVTEVKGLTQRYLLKAALDCTQNSQFRVAKSILAGTEQIPGQIAYYHFETGRVLDFKLISLLSTEQSSPDDILKELTAFLPRDSPDVIEIKERFKDYTISSFNIMKEFCYVYSTELIYKQFNRACAARSYDKVIKTLAMLLKELKSQSNMVFRSDQPLYRGIPKNCMKVEDYETNRKGFWPSFTSTSRNVKIAEEFAGEGGFIFVITLSKSNVHPNVILNNDWSKYPRQEEVLLLPYFSVKTTSIKQHKDGYTYIYLEQNESDSVLSLHDMSIWTQKIEEVLLGSICTEVDRISKDFCSSIDIAKILISENSKSLFWSHIKRICNQVLSQHNANSWKAKITTISNNKEVQAKISDKFKEEIPGIMAQLLKELARNLQQQAKKSISDVIREELLEKHNDIHQDALKNIEFNLSEDVWNNAVHEIANKGIFIPFLKAFWGILFSSYRSSCENELEEKIAVVLWQGYCKSIGASREKLNACSKDLSQKYKKFFLETKQKLQKLVKDMIRRTKV